MTPAQFAAISTLIRLRQSPSRASAYLVLVDGIQQVHAAIQCGLAPQNVNQVVQSVRRAMELAEIAAGQYKWIPPLVEVETAGTKRNGVKNET